MFYTREYLCLVPSGGGVLPLKSVDCLFPGMLVDTNSTSSLDPVSGLTFVCGGDYVSDGWVEVEQLSFCSTGTAEGGRPITSISYTTSHSFLSCVV